MLGETFEGIFTCKGENIEKYIAFSVPIEKEFTIINKEDTKITKTISYKS